VLAGEGVRLRVGVTGHQRRKGADWSWVEAELGRELSAHASSLEGWTSLAAGADQIFARVVLQLGGALVAVVPIRNYERFFATPDQLGEYHRLLSRCIRTVQLDAPDSGQAFVAAGHRIVDECQQMLAVWDGLPARSPGSTGDVVKYARTLQRPITILDPITRTVRHN
jgi:hypothetical protein